MPRCWPCQRLCCLLLLGLVLPSHSQEADNAVTLVAAKSASASTLHYAIEWRLIRAGNARVSWAPSGSASGWQGDLHIESTGLVSKLYRVIDDYRVAMTSELCATSLIIDAREGARHRDTRVTFDREGGKAKYQEKDLVKNTTVLDKETETPACVHDFIGGLQKLRSIKLDAGQSVQLPMSDGKKFAQVKAEAQEREQVRTPAGSYRAMRYEIFLFNDVLVPRKARLFVWLTEDDRRLPVQLRVRLGALVGTISLQLEKEERN